MDWTTCPQWMSCGDLATWLSAIASFVAVVVALYLARHADKPKARGSLRIVFFTPQMDRKLLNFHVVNLGTHPLRISSCFVEFKPWVRRFVRWPTAIAHDWRHPMNSPLPCDLQRGESFNYSTEGDAELGRFLSVGNLPIPVMRRLFRAGVATPWGSIYVDVSKDVKDMLMESAAWHRRHRNEE